MELEKKEKKGSRLKVLYIYRDKLQEAISALKKQKEGVDKTLSEKKEKLGHVMEQIEYINSREMLITTHALERYIERIDPEGTEESMRERIVTPKFMEMVRTLGNSLYPVDDFWVAVSDNKIVTCIKSKGRR